jgi:integrase
LARAFKRKNTERVQWDEAKGIAAGWEAAARWSEAPVATIVSAPVPEAQNTRMKITDAIRVFMSLREGEKITHATLRKYRTFTKQILAFAESRGYVMLDQVTSADMDLFYGGLNLGVRSKAKRLSTLRAFFRFCVNREWLQKNPVSSDLKPPLGSSRVANKIPFTDEELERIINACDLLGEVKWSNWQREGVWTGEDAKDFIWTLTYTGLRTSDVALFNIKRLHATKFFCGQRRTAGMSLLTSQIGFGTALWRAREPGVQCCSA